MIDPKWLDALKLPLKATIAVAVATSILLFLNIKGWQYLGAFGAFARPILIIVVVIFTILSAIGIADFFFAPLRERRHVSALAARRAVRKQEAQERDIGRQRTTLARLDHLSEEEIRYVAECLTKNTPSFYTWTYSSGAGQLVAKGLAWSTGGTHHQDSYPFNFHDFVWTAIRERREEFLSKAAEYKRAREAAKGRRR